MTSVLVQRTVSLRLMVTVKGTKPLAVMDTVSVALRLLKVSVAAGLTSTMPLRSGLCRS